MDFKKRFPLRLWRPAVDDEVDDELEFHLAMRASKLAAGGLSGDEARREALRQFGDMRAVRSECLIIDQERERAMRRAIRFEDLRRDAAFAVRSLTQRKGFTAILLLILGQHHLQQFFVLGTVALWVAVITAVVSGIDYYRRFNHVLTQSAAVNSSLPAQRARP